MNDIYVTITEITADKIWGKLYDSASGRQLFKEVLLGLIDGHFGNIYAESQYNDWARLNLGANYNECGRAFSINKL